MEKSPKTQEAAAMTLMGYLTLALGAFLILLGLYSFWDTNWQHKTALIPSGFGLVFLLLGWLGSMPKWRKHAMHVAAVLALAGLVMTGPDSLAALGQYFSGSEVIRAKAAQEKFLMALATLGYLVMAVRSFIEARLARQEEKEREAREAKDRSRMRRR